MSIYEKNLKAIKKNRPQLHKKLSDIETNERFEVFLPEGSQYPNILDTKNNVLFYEDAKSFIESKDEEYEKYREYIFLYFYGIADGSNVKKLLDNKNLKQLTVVEPNIELIYVAFNLFDFSQDLKENRLLVLEEEEADYSLLIHLFHSSNAKYYLKTFNLIIQNEFYETYHMESYKEMLSLFVRVIDYVASANGNDINDTFRGVKQHIHNLDTMVSHIKYQDLIKKDSIKTAVVVSTGPSLDQNLPLLKEYQDKVIILSVDASFPILTKHGIKPDFVFTMERDEPTAKFFNEVSKEDQQDTIIVAASLQHKVLIESLKSNKISIVMRPFAYNIFFDLNDYGYVCKGMSSANMAHEFAGAFGIENMTFIGQDLAFGEGLQTHANDHIIDKDPELEAEIKKGNILEVEAYGGEGVVQTNIYWNMFRNFIEHHIQETSHTMTSYNSTQGGARIQGSQEIPFKEFLEKFAIVTKDKIDIDNPAKEDIDIAKKQIKEKLSVIKEDSISLQEDINKSFLILAKQCEVLENKSVDEVVDVLNTDQTIFLLSEISRIRKVIEESKIYQEFLSSVIQPLMYSMEVEIAEIKVRYVDNPKDNQIKALQWILAHRYWLFSFSGVIENVIHIIDEYEKEHAI
jgi:hypothetical protein